MPSEIKNVVLCGLGGLGCICASAIADSQSADLKILVDNERLKKYCDTATSFNDKTYYFDYVTPQYKNFKADLIIIATKNNGLDFAIQGIKNFVKEDTIIISLLNGIHSEKEIEKVYPKDNIITCFYLGHSCIRKDRHIEQDGIYNLIIGSDNKENLNKLANFFDKSNINYKIPENIEEEYWKKFIINVGINQLSAATGLPLKDIKADNKLSKQLKDLMYEAAIIAEKEGIKNYQKIYKAAEKFLFEDLDDAVTSMLQDIKAGRKTELDIFAGMVLQLGQKHGIKTPENKQIYKEITNLQIKFI